MTKQYILVVRDTIITNKPKTDETLSALVCYYESPVFYSEGTLKDFNAAIDKYNQHFNHFKNWSA